MDVRASEQATPISLHADRYAQHPRSLAQETVALKLHLRKMPPDFSPRLVVARQGDLLSVGKSSLFLHPLNERAAAAARKVVEELFWCITTSEAAKNIKLPLLELQTIGLDAEQLWSQIDLQLGPVLSRIVNTLKNADFSAGVIKTSVSGSPKGLNRCQFTNGMTIRRDAEADIQRFSDDLFGRLVVQDGVDLPSEETHITEENSPVQQELSKIAGTIETSEGARREHRNAKDVPGIRESSVFQRVQQKLFKQVNSLEEQAMQEKQWQYKGEASGRDRPKNSVLCVDMEFDDVRQSSPIVDELMTATLEHLIQVRISEQRFDEVDRNNVLRSLQDVIKSSLGEDTKSEAGLGELYADAFQSARFQHHTEGKKEGSVTRGDSLATESRKIFTALSSKLDALSHSQLSPKQLVIEELSINTGLAALQVEEAGSVVVSEATMQAPKEIRLPCADSRSHTHNAVGHLAKDELTQHNKKQIRARHKRMKKSSAARTCMTSSNDIHVAGERAKDLKHFSFPQKRLSKSAQQGSISPGYSKSSQVFSKIQSDKDNSNVANTPGKSASSRSIEYTNFKL